MLMPRTIYEPLYPSAAEVSPFFDAWQQRRVRVPDEVAMARVKARHCELDVERLAYAMDNVSMGPTHDFNVTMARAIAPEYARLALVESRAEAPDDVPKATGWVLSAAEEEDDDPLPAPHWPEDGSGDEFDGGYDPTSTMTAVPE